MSIDTIYTYTHIYMYVYVVNWLNLLEGNQGAYIKFLPCHMVRIIPNNTMSRPLSYDNMEKLNYKYN